MTYTLALGGLLCPHPVPSLLVDNPYDILAQILRHFGLVVMRPLGLVSGLMKHNYLTYVKTPPCSRQKANHLLKVWSGEFRNCEDNLIGAGKAWREMLTDFGFADGDCPSMNDGELVLFENGDSPIILTARQDYWHGWSVGAMSC